MSNKKNEVLFIQDSNDFKESLLNDFRKELSQLKKDFQPKEPIEYLTRQQTADLLHVDLSTIWSYTRKHILQSHGLGNRVYYKRAEVEKAIVELKK